MRLIDADRLKIFIKEHSYPVRYGINSVEQGMTLTGISECIDEQPTAYDIDKVVEQLQHQIEQYRRRADKAKQIECISESYYNYGKAYSYEYALEIVRGEQE